MLNQRLQSAIRFDLNAGTPGRVILTLHAAPCHRLDASLIPAASAPLRPATEPAAGKMAQGNGARRDQSASAISAALRRCPVPDLQLLWGLTPIGLRERVYFRRLRRLLVESRSLSSGSAFLMVRASRLT